ncbi:MAG: GAF and ANTAR domain-containing protein [Actinomycetota bacterium]|nr:GAF and ANTAR domain-containing protein [Actinomycetota bacterium]
MSALEGWDAAGTTLVEGDKVATFGRTDPSVDAIDQYQYDSKSGPCVDAMHSAEVNYFDGQSDKPTWRQFREVAAENDVYSVVSFPLKVKDQRVGALNFYSKERDALRPGQREEGMLFAAQAAVTLSNAKAFAQKGAELEQLKEGLETRTMIGQATGLLMGQEGLTSEEAFQKLIHLSQNTNVKLREIAHRYVEVWEGQVNGADKS